MSCGQVCVVYGAVGRGLLWVRLADNSQTFAIEDVRERV